MEALSLGVMAQLLVYHGQLVLAPGNLGVVRAQGETILIEDRLALTKRTLKIARSEESAYFAIARTRIFQRVSR